MSRPGARVFSREFKEAAVGRILAGEKVKALAIEPGGVAEAVVRLVGRPGSAYRAAVGSVSTLAGRHRAGPRKGGGPACRSSLPRSRGPRTQR